MKKRFFLASKKTVFFASSNLVNPTTLTCLPAFGGVVGFGLGKGDGDGLGEHSGSGKARGSETETDSGSETGSHHPRRT